MPIIVPSAFTMQASILIGSGGASQTSSAAPGRSSHSGRYVQPPQGRARNRNDVALLFRLRDVHRQSHAAVLQPAGIDTSEPRCIVLHQQGSVGVHKALRLAIRHTHAGANGLVRLDIVIHNPCRAMHRGGLWDLGDRGSVLFRSLSMCADLTPLNVRAIECLPVASGAVVRGGQRLSIEQLSSGRRNVGGQHLQSDSGMEGAAAAHGYRLAVDGQEYFGHRAEPLLYIEGEQGSLGVAVPRFWQNCPKRISVDRERLEIELFPEIEGNLYELQGGEQKTHTIWFDFAPHTSGDAYARLSEANRTTPWIASCDSYEGAGIIPSCSTAQDSDRRRLDDYLDEAVARLLANRERVDEYGWRNYGDIYADHEEEHYKGRQPLVSHYNNQFDMLLGFLWQYLRTGAERWWELAEPLGRHVMDIDVYRTSRDRAAYSGGMFWFTDHFLHAQTSTHRTYSRHNAGEKPWQYGGGPGAEHNFTSGLALLYRLTGDSDARDTVRLLADWVIGMDDGRRNILGVIDDGPTGLATRTGHSLYHGPGRGAGNSINALLDAYAVTEKSDYLQYAERLIRRCIHPSDDIDSLQFLEPEKRWSYTMFLAALLKYLQVKRDAGQLDGAYAYAQASLLHYARWMLAHERPYFDQVEKLQYPNETWAAQEFRKANVMRLASSHADEHLAEQLMARGTELADRAWSDLLNFNNRASARAMAIVMVEGQIDLALRGTAPEPMPIVPGEGSYGSPSQFVPQRQRVVARLKNPIAAICTIGCVVNPRRWARYFSAPRIEC